MNKNLKIGKYYFTGILIIVTIAFILSGCEKDNDDDVNDGPKWETILFDDFNRANGAIGSDYSFQVAFGSGTISISNNQMKLENGGFYAIRYANPVPDEVIRISLKCTISENTTSGLGFGVSGKSQNLGTDWEIQELYGGWMFLDDDLIGIMKLMGKTLGIPEPLISMAYDINVNISYLMEFTIDNKDLNLKITNLNTNTTEIVNVEDSGTPLTGNIVSINGYQGDGDIIYFDDFKIEKFE